MKVALDCIRRAQKEPLHKQLASAIRGAIQEGHYRPGERIEPERLFMHQAHLSYPTVARAFRQLVTEGLVIRKVGCGTFVADPLPNRNRGTRTVGVVYYQRNEFFLPIYTGIQAECNQERCRAIPVFEMGQVGGEDRVLRKLQNHGVSGILVVPSLLERQHRELIRLIVRHVPIVLIDTYLPDTPCDAVVVDNEGAAETMARHLIELGHRRIVFVTHGVQYPYGTSVRDRLAGVRRALRAAGIGDEEDWQVEFGNPVSSAQEVDRRIHRILEDLLGRGPKRRPTAIMCLNDLVALATIRALRERGLRVPQDISVTGFDDLSWAESVDPPLTTVAQPLERIGRKAARLLFERLLFPNRQPVRVEMDFRLVVRRSTAPPPTGK